MALIFGNFAISDLAAPLSPSDTSMTVALGTGSLFPSPSGSDYFVIVLTDVATKANHEVVWCTARSGDNLTIVRAKEGTTAQSWIVSDLCYNGPTNGQMAAMAQLAGAAFTGTVTVQTPAAGDNSNEAASTEFVQTEFGQHKADQSEVNAGTVGDIYVSPVTLLFGFAASFGTQGYVKFPSWLGGFIIQWANNLPGTYSWPLTFPSSCYAAVSTLNSVSSAATNTHNGISFNASGYTLTSGGDSSAIVQHVIALGR